MTNGLDGINWTCPFCTQPQPLTSERISNERCALPATVHSADLHSGLSIWSQVCANPKCRRTTLAVSFHLIGRDSLGLEKWGAAKNTWRLLPQSSSKPQPDYIPAAIRESYSEACAIRDLSPKASATLARRCLQGIIRDFFGISKNTLDQEIRELRKQVEARTSIETISVDVIDAIDHVRSIGNIGAHMEKNVDVMIDVDPHEAQLLIELVESLLDQLYVERHRRTTRLAELKRVADSKAAQKKLPPPEG